MQEPITMESTRLSLSSTTSAAKMTYCRRKKTRRGKKRYRNRLVSELGNSQTSSDCACDCPYGDIFKTDQLEGDNGGLLNSAKPKRSKRSLRPHTSPKAPPNSTQFLIDDHIAETVLAKLMHCDDHQKHYVADPDSFYKDCYSSNDNDDQCLSPDAAHLEGKTVPAFSTPDNEHPCLTQDDYSMMSFLEQDFEQVFRDARELELISKDKIELVGEVQKLVSLASELKGLVQEEKSIISNVTSPVQNQFHIASLQKEIKCLKEEQDRLTKENERLKL